MIPIPSEIANPFFQVVFYQIEFRSPLFFLTMTPQISTTPHPRWGSEPGRCWVCGCTRWLSGCLSELAIPHDGRFPRVPSDYAMWWFLIQFHGCYPISWMKCELSWGGSRAALECDGGTYLESLPGKHWKHVKYIDLYSICTALPGPWHSCGLLRDHKTQQRAESDRGGNIVLKRSAPKPLLALIQDRCNSALSWFFSLPTSWRLWVFVIHQNYFLVLLTCLCWGCGMVSVGLWPPNFPYMIYISLSLLKSKHDK